MSQTSPTPMAAPVLQYVRPQPDEITRAHLRTGRVFFALAGAIALDVAGNATDLWPEFTRLSFARHNLWAASSLSNTLLLPLGYVTAALVVGLCIRRGNQIAATVAKWVALCLGLYGIAGLALIAAQLTVIEPPFGADRKLASLVGWFSVFGDACLTMFAIIALKHTWHIRPARTAVIADLFRFYTRLAAVYLLALCLPMLRMMLKYSFEYASLNSPLRSYIPSRAVFNLVLALSGISLAWILAALALFFPLRRGSPLAIGFAFFLLAAPAILTGYATFQNLASVLLFRSFRTSGTYSMYQAVWNALFDTSDTRYFVPTLALTILCAAALIRALQTPRHPT